MIFVATKAKLFIQRREIMFDPVYIFLVIAIGFTVYGINQLGEKFRGHYLSSTAEDSLNELCDYCDGFLRSVPVPKHQDKKKIRRHLKPVIMSTYLSRALEDLETDGKESRTAVWLKREADLVLTELRHLKKISC
jgi:hypothetical protein